MSKARDLANAGTALTSVSATELGYLDGVTSAVQTQINAKQATVSGVNDTEIGYLDGVTSAIQTQINAQIPKSTITAKGDLLVGTGSGTLVAQGVGANGTVLTANSAQADGVEWATPASGGMTLLSTTSLSGTSTTVSSISSGYTHLYIEVFGATWGTGTQSITFGTNSMGSDGAWVGIASSSASVQYGTVQTRADISSGQVWHQSNGFKSSIWVYDYAAANGNRVGSYNTWGFYTNQYRVAQGCFGWYSGTAVSSVTIFAQNNYSFTGGTMRVYGVK